MSATFPYFTACVRVSNAKNCHFRFPYVMSRIPYTTRNRSSPPPVVLRRERFSTVLLVPTRVGRRGVTRLSGKPEWIPTREYISSGTRRYLRSLFLKIDDNAQRLQRLFGWYYKKKHNSPLVRLHIRSTANRAISATRRRVSMS